MTMSRTSLRVKLVFLYLEMKSSLLTSRTVSYSTQVEGSVVRCDSLYPPQILLMPVKALRPWRTRQLSKTKSPSAECTHQNTDSQAIRTEDLSRLQLNPTLHVRSLQDRVPHPSSRVPSIGPKLA